MIRRHVPGTPIVDTSDFVWFVRRVYHPSRFIRYRVTKIRPKHGDGKYRDMVKITFIYCAMGIGLSTKTTKKSKPKRSIQERHDARPNIIPKTPCKALRTTGKGRYETAYRSIWCVMISPNLFRSVLGEKKKKLAIRFSGRKNFKWFQSQTYRHHPKSENGAPSSQLEFRSSAGDTAGRACWSFWVRRFYRCSSAVRKRIVFVLFVANWRRRGGLTSRVVLVGDVNFG